ncbi:MAG: hypothetical protein PHW50_00905 [Patescibacteria group bacterium]|nr:hypothetical protein [Patescibacteria group bacterium]
MSIVWTTRNPNAPVLKRTISQQMSLGPITVKFLAILVIAFLSIFYLFQSNSSAAKAFMTRDLETKQENLTAENERLQYEAERLKSLSQTESAAKEKGMVQVENIDARIQ